MVKKLSNFLRRLKKWWREFKLVEEAMEENYVIMKYNLGVVKYKDCNGKISNYIARKEKNDEFVIYDISTHYKISFNYIEENSKDGVLEWLPINKVTEKINNKYKKELINPLHEGIEEKEYQIIQKELPVLL